METQETTIIKIEATVNAFPEKIWKVWTNPDDIIKWNTPSPDWHTPRAEQDFRTGGKFPFRMEVKDGSFGFDSGGDYDVIVLNEYIEYTIGDGRKVKTTFKNKANQTRIIQYFEAETFNSIERERSGWEAILLNFKQYVESV